MKNHNRKSWVMLVIVTIILGLLLFISAGTLYYWQAWVYLTIYFFCAMLSNLYLIHKDPALHARRMKGGPIAEKEKVQKIIMAFLSLGFIALYIFSALDHRFSWSTVPTFFVIIADLSILLSFYMIYLTYKANTFAAATIQVEETQSVISTGPYAIVRHPMYSGALIMLIATPVALGSWLGLLVFIFIVPLLIWRIIEEEKFLIKHLTGYQTYADQVRYRLIPGVF